MVVEQLSRFDSPFLNLAFKKLQPRFGQLSGMFGRFKVRRLGRNAIVKFCPRTAAASCHRHRVGIQPLVDFCRADRICRSSVRRETAVLAIETEGHGQMSPMCLLFDTETRR